MKILVTGASGYVGGSVASHLAKKGYQIFGLVRDERKAIELKSYNIQPVIGDLDSYDAIRNIVLEFDGIIHCADSDHAHFVQNILEWYRGKNKFFIHTSGSSIVSDKAMGTYNPRIHSENNFQHPPEKSARVGIDTRILAASRQGIRTAVICPTMIYGEGLGPKKNSIQVPLLEKLAVEIQRVAVIGQGKNVWSNVHIKDLAELFELTLEQVLENKISGELFFAENGQASFYEIAQALQEKHHFKNELTNLEIDAAIKIWGPDATQYALASNSIVSSEKARKILNWRPKHNNLLTSI